MKRRSSLIIKTILIGLNILFFALFFASCSPGNQEEFVKSTETLKPTSTQTPKPVPNATATPEPKATFTITPTCTPSSTYTPKPITVQSGEIFYRWGLYQSTAPYLVWGASLRDTMKGSCQGFICDGIDLRLYDPEIWEFIGFGEYGRKTFTFDNPLDTFVIHYDRDNIGFDAFIGITVDGESVNYGYLIDGRISASYLDSGAFNFATVITAENKGVPVDPPCGIIDPSEEGDKSYSLASGSGGVVFNFLDRGFYNNAFATRKGYELMSITIISAPASKISADQSCP